MPARQSRTGRYDTLFVVSAIWFLAKFVRYAFPPLFEELQVAFDVSNAAIGTAFTGFMVVYAVMQFPSGILGDRFGSARVITAGVLVATVGAFVVVLGGPFLLLGIAMLVMGAGTGAHKTVSVTFLARVYPSRTGRTLGVFDTAGTFGGVLAPIAVAVALGFAIDWRAVFLVAGVTGILLTAAFIRQTRHNESADPTEEGMGMDISLRAYGAPFTNHRFVGFVVVTLGFGFTYNGLVAFLPLYLVREAGLSTATASLLYSLLFVVSVVQVVTGELADRVGRLTVITATLSLSLVSLAALLFVPTGGIQIGPIPLVTGLAVVGLGLGSHGFRPVRGLHLAAILPDSLASGGLGVVRSALMGAGAISPAIVGFLVDTAGFPTAFGLLLGTLAVAVSVVFGLLLTEKQERNTATA